MSGVDKLWRSDVGAFGISNLWKIRWEMSALEDKRVGKAGILPPL